MFTNTAGFGEAARECLSSGCNPRKGDDKGDHPPITPQRIATESEVGGEAYRVYDYIVNHFLASLMKDYKESCGLLRHSYIIMTFIETVKTTKRKI